MSACVSSHGEYSAHDPYGPNDLAGPPFECAKCHLFDEDAALRRIAELEDAAGEHVQAIVSAVVQTLREAAGWLGRGEEPILREAADDIEQADLAELACCPFCSEVICDDGCPLYGVRRRLLPDAAWP